MNPVTPAATSIAQDVGLMHLQDGNEKHGGQGSKTFTMEEERYIAHKAETALPCHYPTSLTPIEQQSDLQLLTSL